MTPSGTGWSWKPQNTKPASPGVQRASSIACAVHAACCSAPASSDDQPNSDTITGTPASRASAGTSSRSMRLLGVAHRERRPPQRVGVNAEEVHRHAVGVQPRRPRGGIAARVAIAREVAGGDLRRGVGRVDGGVHGARHRLVGLDGVGLGEHPHVGLVPVVEQPHLRIAARGGVGEVAQILRVRAARRSAPRRRWPMPARARTRAARLRPARP